jgi:hypothetical protein
MNQSTNTVLMIRPASFKYNEETAVNNYYQKKSYESDTNAVEIARREFDGLVDVLSSEGIQVQVIDDTSSPEKPDSLFPNNWISFHEDDQCVLYPMYAPNRRLERRRDLFQIPDSVKQTLIDLSHFELNGKYLEGTGSLVLDRINKVAYACISDRTHPELVSLWCEKMGYEAVAFRALQTVHGKRLPIYHTNVIMCIGTHFAVFCEESVDDLMERAHVIQSLKRLGKEIVLISESQVNAFAGNMLEVKTEMGETKIVMSTSAFHSLTNDQRNVLGRYGKLIHAPLAFIESNGGGSARCMIAEIF